MYFTSTCHNNFTTFRLTCSKYFLLGLLRVARSSSLALPALCRATTTPPRCSLSSSTQLVSDRRKVSQKQDRLQRNSEYIGNTPWGDGGNRVDQKKCLPRELKRVRLQLYLGGFLSILYEKTQKVPLFSDLF